MSPSKNPSNESFSFSKDKKTQPISGLGGAIPNEPDIYNEQGIGLSSTPLFLYPKSIKITDIFSLMAL